MTRKWCAILLLCSALVGVGIWHGSTLYWLTTTRLIYTRTNFVPDGTVHGDRELAVGAFRYPRFYTGDIPPGPVKHVEGMWRASDGTTITLGDQRSEPDAPWIRRNVSFEVWWEDLPESKKTGQP